MNIKTLALTCAFLMAPALAMATPGNNGNGEGGCGVGQQTNGCAPVHNYSPHFQGAQYQGQAQGQLQGQAQAQGQRSTNVNRNSSRASAHNAGNRQTMNYQEARHRLQAPNVYGSFAGGATSPCERNTFGVGGSGPGFGGLFQIPVSSDTCWGERAADRLLALGCTNAGLAVLAGDPVRVALVNNPCRRAR